MLKAKSRFDPFFDPFSFFPEWQFDFLKQVFEIADITAKKNHVLMSSHSAVTLILHDKKNIKFFDIKGKHANCYDLPKSVAIKKFSAILMGIPSSILTFSSDVEKSMPIQ